MKRPNITPGPWNDASTGEKMRKEYSQPYGVAQLGVPNLIAGVFGDGRGGEDAAKANAKAIGALSDLLAALELLFDGCQQAQKNGLNQPQVNGGMILAKSALIKAGYTFP